jgi:hypothetical protein
MAKALDEIKNDITELANDTSRDVDAKLADLIDIAQHIEQTISETDDTSDTVTDDAAGEPIDND